jgi:AraC-like DNA-binding protein
MNGFETGIVQFSRLDLPLMKVERIIYRNGDRALREKFRQENAFLIQIELSDGTVSIRDLRYPYIGVLHAPMDRISFRISFDDLRAFARQSGRPEFTMLRCDVGLRDPSLHGLAQALVPTLVAPGQASRVFLEQMGLATLVYVTQTYGGLHFPAHRKGGLSAQQEKLATRFLAEHLTQTFSLAELASFCGLSKSYFSKAFKQTLGKTPRQWLTEYRVARACDLLGTAQPIAQIALACGFTDQSHMTRVFSDTLQETPAKWRRALAPAQLSIGAPAMQPPERIDGSGENRLAPSTRRHANHARENAREVALIHEAAGIGNFAER